MLPQVESYVSSNDIFAKAKQVWKLWSFSYQIIRTPEGNLRLLSSQKRGWVYDSLFSLPVVQPAIPPPWGLDTVWCHIQWHHIVAELINAVFVAGPACSPLFAEVFFLSGSWVSFSESRKSTSGVSSNSFPNSTKECTDRNKNYGKRHTSLKACLPRSETQSVDC